MNSARMSAPEGAAARNRAPTVESAERSTSPPPTVILMLVVDHVTGVLGRVVDSLDLRRRYVPGALHLSSPLFLAARLRVHSILGPFAPSNNRYRMSPSNRRQILRGCSRLGPTTGTIDRNALW